MELVKYAAFRPDEHLLFGVELLVVVVVLLALRGVKEAVKRCVAG